MLKFTVHSDISEAVTRELAKSSKQAEYVVAVEVQKDTSPFVPFLNGKLSQATRVDGGYIIYPPPYSRYLYYGKLMVDPETGSSWVREGEHKVLTDIDLVFSKRTGHGQAQSHWFEASKAQNIQKWIRVADKAVKHGLEEK